MHDTIYHPHFHGVGGAFFPEHHPRETWDEYVALIHDAGLSFVRMAEFTWDKLEPRKGEFDFTWLDDVLARLDRAHIGAILCTPTAVPPLWMCEQYPEILPVNESGKTIGFGGRRYTCPTSPAYIAFSTRIAAKMAEQYGASPQIIGWQIDNELGHPFCFCPRCLTAFQQWCQQRFTTIEQLNDAICMHFLGQTLTAFSQLMFPTTYNHPGLWLLYHQFYSEVTIACFRAQIQALKAGGVTVPITTNMMNTWYGYDHAAMGGELDVIAGDHYALHPGTLFGDAFSDARFIHAFLRGMKPERNIWFHEFQWGRGGGTQPLPGQVRWAALTQIGLGADLLDFFRFDMASSGMERDVCGLLGVHRKPGRIYDEVQSLAADLAAITPHLEGTVPTRADVAILFTHDNHCEFARVPKSPAVQGPHGNGYPMHLARHLQAITHMNIACDIVHQHGDFSAYRVIIAPTLYVLPPELAEKLERFVADGGTLLLTSLSGVVDENGTLLDTPIPGPLAPVCGIEVRDYGQYYAVAGPVTMMPSGETLSFSALPVTYWIDEIRPVAADVEVLATFDNPFYAGVPAFTRHRYQRGQAFYLGTLLDQDGYDALYRALCPLLGLRPQFELPEGIYATIRTDGERRIVFLNNPATSAKTITLQETYTDLISGEPCTGSITLPPFTVRVLG